MIVMIDPPNILHCRSGTMVTVISTSMSSSIFAPIF